MPRLGSSAAAFFAFLLAASHAGTGGAAELTIPGTGDSQDLLRLLAKAYEAQHPGASIQIPNSTGTAGGMEAAGTGESVLGRVALRPSAEDQAKHGPLSFIEFARVPVAFVVSSSAAVDVLDETQICDVFSGRVSSWREVGGADLAVRVQARPEAGSNMVAIRAKIPCFEHLVVTPSAKPNERNADLVASMRETPGAIGFMPLSEARLHRFHMVRLGGVDPGSDGYPVWISLGFVHKAPLEGLAKDFVTFLATDEAGKIMRDTGHIPAATAVPAAGSSAPGEGEDVKRAPGSGDDEEVSLVPRVGGFAQILFLVDPDAEPTTEFTIPHARIRVSGNILSKRVSYGLLVDFRPALHDLRNVDPISPQLLEVYGQYERYDHAIKVGQFKTPFGWENPKQLSWFPTPVRSFLADNLAVSQGSSRDIGVGVSGSIALGGDFVLEDGIALVSGQGKNLLDLDESKDVIARIALRFRKNFHVGVSGARNRFVRVSKTDPNDRTLEKSLRLGFDGGFESKTCLLVGELIVADIDAKAETQSFGYYVLGAWRILPPLEAVARYEHYNPVTDTPGDDNQRLWAGANVFAFPEKKDAVKLSLFYRRSFGAVEGDAFFTQLQFQWK